MNKLKKIFSFLLKTKSSLHRYYLNPQLGSKKHEMKNSIDCAFVLYVLTSGVIDDIDSDPLTTAEIAVVVTTPPTVCTVLIAPVGVITMPIGLGFEVVADGIKLTAPVVASVLIVAPPRSIVLPDRYNVPTTDKSPVIVPPVTASFVLEFVYAATAISVATLACPYAAVVLALTKYAK